MNLSTLVTRIKIELGLYSIALPVENVDQYITDIIQNITLRTFSTYCPYKETYRFGTATLVFRHKRYFLHIPVTFEVDGCCDSDICNVVGIDRGINFVVATYDSKHQSGFVSGKVIKQKRGHYKNLRKQLQQVGTPSSRRRLKAIGQRENRWMQDVNHCVSKALVENNPKHTLFVLEDLSGVRFATERVRVKDRYVRGTAVLWEK